ncbi:MAG: hypothetical protein P4L84_37755 [Isosphaeraceae bacterium]|nr:hypothetical protein [Isosphaeraceae bacterium]
MTTHIRLALRIALAAVLFAGAAEGGRADDVPATPAKKLIEFGWDEPDTAFLRGHVSAMEQTPFDGCVFHALTQDAQGRRENLAWLGWGRRAFTEGDLEAAVADLKATPFRRFTHNFLRFNTAPGDLDWFDDHAAIQNNARVAAWVAREGKCAGVLFDVEEYQGRLFTYANQRDAKTKTWNEYVNQARVRGREVMAAFQEGFPGLTVFLTFGHSLPRTTSKEGKTPLAESECGLLAPFLDGMVEAARGGARIVDGFELSYGYKTKEQFEKGYRLMTAGVLPIVAQPERYRQVVSAGFGIWLDYDWRKKGWETDDPSRNYFTPESLETSLRGALQRSDEFVWIYTETPRWWSAEGGRVKLPAAYEAAIRRSRGEPGED